MVGDFILCGKVKMKVAQIRLTLGNPMDYTAQRVLEARILESVAIPFSRSPELQVDSLPAEPPRKPRNTGVGSLSLLQGIFPTQE